MNCSNSNTKSLLTILFGMALAVLSAGLGAEEKPGSGTTPCNSRDVVVGDLKFSIVSVRASHKKQSFHVVTSLSIKNQGKSTVILNYKNKSGRLADNFGRIYEIIGSKPNGVTGIGTLKSDHGSLEYFIEPDREMGVQMEFYSHSMKESLGSSFDFVAEFVSVEDAGKGKLRTIRAYPVSIVGALPSGG